MILRNFPASKIRRAVTCFASGIALGLSAHTPAAAQDSAAQVAVDQSLSPSQLLAQLDLRLVQIAERLLESNHEFCRKTMPLTGMALHSRDQYGENVELNFTGSDIGIAAVVPDSPAARAGLAAGDALITLGGVDLRAIRHDGEQPFRDVIFDMVAQAPPADPIALTVMRDGAIQNFEIIPQTGCRALVEILVEDDLKALSDGRVIQVSHGMAGRVNDEQLAVIFAHELAHLVLEHRLRLEAAGISKGALGELGKNQRINRQVEVEADRLSVHLLANAGYDPNIAPQFWFTDIGKRAGGGMMRSWIYPSPAARSQIMSREIADYLPLGAGPSVPAHLLSRRDRAF